MKSIGSILLVVSIVMVATCMGAGYAAEYSASSVNSGNTLSSTYMIIEYNDNAIVSGNSGSATTYGTFTFSDIVYYRDVVISSEGNSTNYKSYEKTSDPVKVFIDHHPSETVGTSMTVKLTSAVQDATLVIQYYDDQACTIVHDNGSPITLTTTDQSAGVFDTNTEYYCKLTLTMSTSTLSTTPAGTVTFGISMTATATAA